MKRRSSFEGVSRPGLFGTIPSIGDLSEDDYQSPFPKYRDYISFLQASRGKNVLVQESFNISGASKRLVEVSRFPYQRTNLFPHSIRFNMEEPINLKSIRMISKLGHIVSVMDIDPEDERVLYLDIEGQKDFQKYMTQCLESMNNDFRRFAY